jgi:hypothetical protein
MRIKRKQSRVSNQRVVPATKRLPGAPGLADAFALRRVLQNETLWDSSAYPVERASHP